MKSILLSNTKKYLGFSTLPKLQIIFRGEEYADHTKCLTEEERYAAKGSFSNGVVKKGEVKQESWIEMIKSIINEEENLKPSIRNLLTSISNYNNVPRKKPKFLVSVI